MNSFQVQSWLFLYHELHRGIMMMAYILHSEITGGLCLENIYIF